VIDVDIGLTRAAVRGRPFGARDDAGAVPVLVAPAADRWGAAGLHAAHHLHRTAARTQCHSQHRRLRPLQVGRRVHKALQTRRRTPCLTPK
jgi:hypothetical protein